MLYCGLWSPALHGRMGLAARARIAMRLPPGRPFSAGPRAIARPRAAALPLLRRQPPVSRGVRFQTTLGQKIAQNRRFHFLNYMSGLIPALLLYLWYDFKYTKQEDHAGPPSRDEVLEILASGGGIVDAEGKPVDIKEAAEGKTLGLYFSALWCPPCRQFSPLLRYFYEVANHDRSSIEIVFISCDLNKEQHTQYVRAAHDKWLHVPYEQQDLQRMLKKLYHCWAGPKDAEELGRDGHKSGIPCLVLISPGEQTEVDGVEYVRRWHMQALHERAMRAQQNPGPQK